jgi:hypothetical protein
VCIAVVGAFLALASFGTFSALAQAQKHKIITNSRDPLVPKGFDCSKIHELGIDKQENLRAGAIMMACSQAQEGSSSVRGVVSRVIQKLPLPAAVKKLLPNPMAYGAADVDLITGDKSFPNVTQSETFTTANPDNPNQIVVAYNDSRGRNFSPINISGASVSTDGGTTFTRLTKANGQGPFDNTFGDPVILYHKPSGTWVTVWLDGGCGGQGIGGYSSTTPQDPNSWTHYCGFNEGSADRESGWADNNPSSPFFGRLYISWNDFNQPNANIFSIHSTDGGATWSSPVMVSTQSTFIRDVQITGDLAGSGTIYVAGMDEGGGGFPHMDTNLLFKSTDGGSTWTNTYTGTPFPGPGVTAVGYFAQIFNANGGYWRHEGWGEPAAINNFVHLVYDQHGTGSDPADVYYIRSTDGGVTFGTPVKLNTDSTTRPNWQPNLSVSPTGTLFATWYDARETPGPDCAYGDPTMGCYRMWARKSQDNGATWLPDDTLSDVISPLPAQPDPGIQPTYAGDYDYGTAIASKHLTSWTDGRNAINNTSQQDAFTDRELVGFSVTTANPACGSFVIGTAPTQFTVDLTDPVNPTTVHANALTVNGTPADNFTLMNGNTEIQFTFNSSPAVQGSNTMHIPAGAFNRASDNQPNLEFQCTFRYAQQQLTVTDTSPPVGGTFQPPGPATYTYDMNFNEPVDPNSVQTTDLQLSGIPGSSVTSVTVINGNMTAEFMIQIQSIFSGTLTVNLPAGAITDQFGNPGAAFTGTYQYVGNAPPGCGLLVGSGLTLGYTPNNFAQIASNTVQYTFAIGQPAANDFAIFDTHDPWGGTVLKDAITANGHTYTEFMPADLATVNFSAYRVIVLNWDDTSLVDFITPYSAAIPALEAYASAGGVVWVQGAIQGSPGDNYPMPFGGQGNGADFSSSDNIVDPSSPMMLGIPNPITGNFASHVSFTGLPGPEHTVVINPSDNQPVLYDLQIGGTCGATPSPTPTPTTTPTVSPSPTPTATATTTPTVSPSVTPTATPTSTPTVSPTPRVTPRPRPTPYPRPTPR